MARTHLFAAFIVAVIALALAGAWYARAAPPKAAEPARIAPAA